MVVYGFGLVKLLRRENEWTRAAQRLVPLLAVIAAALLAGRAGHRSGRVSANDGTVPIQMAGAAGRGDRARRPGGGGAGGRAGAGPRSAGPLRARPDAYVYAAEALAALSFLHIRVTMPWLFSGWFLRFWPLVVMAIAFVGVGLGELFQRRRQTVLSEPLQTTGALLPLLPALGFWVTSSEVHYSLLLARRSACCMPR